MSGYAYVDSQKISEIIECPLCLEILTDPQIIPCSHSFCQKCLENLIKQKRLSNKDASEFSCPMCRASFKEDDLISNPALSQLIFEVSKLIKAAKESPDNGTLPENKLKQFLNSTSGIGCNQKSEKIKQKSHSVKVSKNSTKRHSMINQSTENLQFPVNSYSMEPKLRLNCDNLHKVIQGAALAQKHNAPLIPPRKYSPFLNSNSSNVSHIPSIEHHFNPGLDINNTLAKSVTNNFMNLINANHYNAKATPNQMISGIHPGPIMMPTQQPPQQLNNQQPYYFYNQLPQQQPQAPTNHLQQASTNFPSLFSPSHEQPRQFF